MALDGKERSPLLAQSFASRPVWPIGIDFALFAVFAACAWGILSLAQYWWSAPTPAAVISQWPGALPLYALYSLVRIFAA